jgi:hypothetical protein
MASPLLDDLPGYRRRFVVTPAADWVRCQLEDDYHCMQVTIRHVGGIATAIEAAMPRAPWTTCPGAAAQLERTFANVALADFAARGEKKANCTHLHDLALLAAAHAGDDRPVAYDILVSDAVGGRRESELRRNGNPVMHWKLEDGRIFEPMEIAGLDLFDMNPWIGTLDRDRKEAARLLRWGTMMAHGRTMSLEDLSDPQGMPPGRCYTFQPDVVVNAQRVGEIKDFSRGGARPLDDPAIFESTHKQDAA